MWTVSYIRHLCKCWDNMKKAEPLSPCSRELKGGASKEQNYTVLRWTYCKTGSEDREKGGMKELACMLACLLV